MATAVWRYLLTSFALFALFVGVGDAFDRARLGNIGIIYDALSEQQAIVRTVLPGSQASRLGVRAGDRIRAPWVRSAAIFGELDPFTPRAGAPLTFYDERLRRNVTVIAVPLPTTFALTRVLAHICKVLIILLGLWLFWNLSSDRAARALGAFLITYELQGWGNTGSFALPPIAIALIIETTWILMFLFLVEFACWFPERYPRDARRSICIGSTIATGVMTAIGILSTVYARYGNVPHIPDAAFYQLNIYVWPLLMVLPLLAALAIDFRMSSRLDRLRLEWLAFGMALLAYVFVSYGYFPSLFITFGGSFSDVALVLNDIFTIAGIFCISYAFLRYRVLDITFAISKATVYAILSTLIVAAFALVEYLVGKYVESHSHVTGAIITLVFALTLGVGLRRLHSHVDGLTDRLIFRSRYEAEEALRSFGRRAAFFTGEKGLQDTTVAALVQYARAESAALYLIDGDGDYTMSSCYPALSVSRISHEDPAVLALKDERSPQLIPKTSRLDGEMVFPMFVRGELMAFVSCGKRRIRETYTPDEIEAMSYALEHVGVQLDAIQTARLQKQLAEIQRILSAYHMLGADAGRALAQITNVSGVKERGYEESTLWKTPTKPDGPSVPKTSSTT